MLWRARGERGLVREATVLQPGIRHGTFGLEQVTRQHSSTWRKDVHRVAVWDSVLINDELDLLEARLQVLWPVVDHFVVVEADRTFTGIPKPLYVRDAWPRFAQYAAKLSLHTATLPETADSAWTREHLQEFKQRDGLTEAAETDLVLVGDIDEIPYPAVVRALDAHLVAPLRLVMRHCLFRVNWELPLTWEAGTFAFRWRDREDRMARWHLGDTDEDWRGYTEPVLDDAGWHLSYLGDEAAVRRKVQAFAHQELNTARDMAPAHLQRCLRHRTDLVGRYVLDRVHDWALDPVLSVVAGQQPEWVDRVADPPSAAACAAFAQWVAIRRHPRTPDLVVRLFDSSPLLLMMLRPALLALSWARQQRRNRRSPDSAWKVARRLTLQDLM